MTSIEQSKRLIACGVSPDSADLYKQIYKENYIFIADHFADDEKGVYPIWSVAALLKLIPKEYTDDNGYDYYFSISQSRFWGDEYVVSYIPCYDDGESAIETSDKELVEAIVQFIEKLKTDGCI